MDNNKEKPISSAPNIFRIGAVLLIISTLIAGLLAVINGLTAPVIENNKNKEKNDAMTAVFGGFDHTEQAERSLSEPVTAVYEVYGSDGLDGYCVFVTESGFGGDLELMVGTDTAGKLMGIRILSMSETPGVGAKINDDSYLASYNGADASVELGHGVDAIAGATISSKALMRGVKAALAPEVLFGGGDTTSSETSDVSETEIAPDNAQANTDIPPETATDTITDTTIPPEGESTSSGGNTDSNASDNAASDSASTADSASQTSASESAAVSEAISMPISGEEGIA